MKRAKPLVEYEYEKETSITPLNAVGVTDSTTLRTIPSYNDNTARFVAENGSDITGVGTQANPWRTIKYAIAHMNDITYIRTSIVFLRNGMTGDIHSYQPSISDPETLAYETTIFAELGESRIFLHWDNGDITTPITNSTIRDMIVSPNDDKLLITYKSGLYNYLSYTNDGDTINTIASSGSTTAHKFCIYNNIIFLSYSLIGIPSSTGMLLYSTDNGLIWNIVPNMTSYDWGYNYIRTVNSGIMCFALPDSSNQVRVVVGDGVNWNYVYTFPINHIPNGVMAMYNDKLYVAFTDGTIEYTDDDGLTWNSVSSPLGLCTSMRVYGGKLIAIIGGKVYYSADGIYFNSTIVPTIIGNYISCFEIDGFLFMSWYLTPASQGTYYTLDLAKFTAWKPIENSDILALFKNKLFDFKCETTTRDLKYTQLALVNLNDSEYRIKFNGFNFSGHSKDGYDTLYGIKDGAISCYWCSFRDYLIDNISPFTYNHDIDVKNCDIRGGKRAIYNRTAHSMNIRENILYNVETGVEIRFFISTTKSYLTNNTIYGSEIGLKIQEYTAANSTNLEVSMNIFHRNVIDIQCQNYTDPISNKNIFNSVCYWNVSPTDIIGIDPLFVDEEAYDYHIQTTERKTPSDEYYNINSIAKADGNPQAAIQDIGAYYEHRELISETWKQMRLDPKSMEISEVPVSSESGYGISGAFYMSFAKRRRKFVLGYGDDWQQEKGEEFNLPRLIDDRHYKRFYPSGAGVYVPEELGTWNGIDSFSFSTSTYEPNELVGKWLVLLSNSILPPPYYYYSYYIDSNTANEIKCVINTDLASAGIYNAYIIEGILSVSGYLNHSTLEYTLGNSSTGFINPLPIKNQFKNYVISLQEDISSGLKYYYRIVEHDGLILKLARLSVSDIYLGNNFCTIEWLPVHIMPDDFVYSQRLSSNFVEGGSLYDYQSADEKRQHLYRFEKLSLLETEINEY